ncbi:MAG: hypothetical protein JNM27_17705 [Leptospirales bacterium]|nr:hypothetical protein [Leptospirales bacterium]
MKSDMYFLGLGLILIGLLSLLALFFAVSLEKRVEGTAEGPAPAAPFVAPVTTPAYRPGVADSGDAQHTARMSEALAQAAVTTPASPAPVLTEGRPIRRAEPAQIVVFGALYLDHARNLSIFNTRNPEELPARVFSDFKRVGKGSLVCEGSGFFFKSGHASYQYPVGDLEQIVFLETGVALLPASVKSPIAIFLTDESDRVKAFIRENSV